MIRHVMLRYRICWWALELLDRNALGFPAWKRVWSTWNFNTLCRMMVSVRRPLLTYFTGVFFGHDTFLTMANNVSTVFRYDVTANTFIATVVPMMACVFTTLANDSTAWPALTRPARKFCRCLRHVFNAEELESTSCNRLERQRDSPRRVKSAVPTIIVAVVQSFSSEVALFGSRV